MTDRKTPTELADVALDEAEGGYDEVRSNLRKLNATGGNADDRPTEEVAFYYNKIGHTY